MLTEQLGVTKKQAEGGAGSIFKYAKSKLSPQKFGQVAKVIPDMDGLLKAAPAASSIGGIGGSTSSQVSSALGGMLGSKSRSVSTTGGLASLAGAFSKLGLSSEMVQKFAPPILSYVEKSGGATVKNLLASVLT
ncbi:MAG: DUF2780 domain-containing protein [bacterium]|nr:DUF2780 domain-containing protein [bacterium]